MLHEIAMTRRFAPFLALLVVLLAGCGDNVALVQRGGSPAAPPEYRGDDPLAGDDDDASGGDDDGTDTVEIVSLEPAPGSDTHHYRAPLVIRFTGDATGFDVSVTGPAQGYVPVEVMWNDAHDRATVWAQPRLLPATAYSVTIAAGSVQQTFGFSTSRIGLLDVDAATLDGAVFVLDASAATTFAPAGLDAASASLVGRPLVRFEVAGSGGLEIHVGLGTADGDGWVQDTCAPTASVQSDEPVTLDAAMFGTTGTRITVPLGGAVVELEDGWIEGDVTPDGQGLVAFGVSGFAPSESLAAALGVQDACSFAAEQLGAACVTCPSEAGECLWIDVAGLTAARWTLDWSDVGDEDAAACVEGPSALFGCSAAGGRAPGALALLACGVCVALRMRPRRS